MAQTSNNNLHRAREAKNDEFYTTRAAVEKELWYYRNLLKGKTVLCNCNDASRTAFTDHFVEFFSSYGLKRLIAVAYTPGGNSYWLNLLGDNNIQAHPLEGDGGFDTPECIALLQEADIVVTNPPFSRFRDFLDLVLGAGKDLLVIGNQNALTYKNVFRYIQDGRLRCGMTHPKEFLLPGDRGIKKFGLICWFTSLVPEKEDSVAEPSLWRKYDPALYPKYDNYDAIEVSRLADIPIDYPGVMGVPLTYLAVHCPQRFELVGTQRYFYDTTLCRGVDPEGNPSTCGALRINGAKTYYRIFIRHINPAKSE